MSILQQVSKLNVVQFLGTRKAWVWPGAYAITALIQSGIGGVNMSDWEQTAATVAAWGGAILLAWADAERDKRLGV